MSVSGIMPIVAGFLTPWLIYGLAWLRDQSVLPPKPHQVELFKLVKAQRLAGIVILLFSLGLTLMMIGVNLGHDEPLAGWIGFFVGLLVGGFGSITGVQLWAGRYRLSAQGLWATSRWGLPRFIEWRSITAVEHSPVLQSYRFSGAGQRVYVPLAIDNRADFEARLDAFLPNVHRDAKLYQDTETLHLKTQYAGLRRYAPVIALVSAVIVIATGFVVQPGLYTVLWATLGGLALAAHPLYIIWAKVPDPKKDSQLRLVTFIMFIIALQASMSTYTEPYGGSEAIADWDHAMMILQIMAISVLTATGLMTISQIIKKKG